LFDITVECNRVTNQYYIVDETDSQSREVRKLLDNALFLNNLASKEILRRHIALEPVCSDVRYQHIVIEAIEESRDLLLTYRHNYDARREETLRVKPIGLKLFRQRWYLVAEKSDGQPYSYPFDRILKLEAGNKTAPTAYDMKALFDDSYGIMREKDIAPVEMCLKVEREEANYLEALPLHPSQRVVERNDGYTIFSLTVCPTYDFIMEILSHGHKIEILSPPSLRSEISDRIKMSYRLYE
ncbi:MAG: WYL domain-containing protein, partial [Muribaculaceae bacterium]|nr:WYL domain-containing protein [Muribaculaceae bacterium]